MERQIPAFLTLFMTFFDFVFEDEGDFHKAPWAPSGFM